jgi:probable rRNA maturation factor
MDIQFINTEKWGIDEKVFKPVIERLKHNLPKAQGELNVIFVDDQKIHELNKAYRHKDQPTDVLSFSYLDRLDPSGDPTLGEVFISVPRAKEQAPLYKNNLNQEIEKLIVHGVLHIFGYDHETEADYKVMAAFEKKILG